MKHEATCESETRGDEPSGHVTVIMWLSGERVTERDRGRERENEVTVMVSYKPTQKRSRTVFSFPPTKKINVNIKKKLR